MQRAATAEQLLTRGVWLAPYLFDGCQVLIAIDSRGGVRKHLKLHADIQEEAAVRWLEQLLDRIDPVPRLALVKHEPPKPQPQRIAPAAYEDRAAYLIRLGRQTAAKIPYFRD